MSDRKANKIWRTSQRDFVLSDKTLVMAILNVTPDSFSDGGRYNSRENSLRQTEKLIAEGADIIDIGGESTRPNAERVLVEEETARVVPTIEAIKKRFDIPVSVDTSKSLVAEKAVEAGAEIINDVSGLKFDKKIAKVVAKHGSGLVLMHLRGEFETMHKQEPVRDILSEVVNGLAHSVKNAIKLGINAEQICLDVGIGFSKSFEQNLELIAKLDKVCSEFEKFPMLIGTSRKSFIGKILGDIPTDRRRYGTLAANIISVLNGADIVRVHDVRETVEALKVTDVIAGTPD